MAAATWPKDHLESPAWGAASRVHQYQQHQYLLDPMAPVRQYLLDPVVPLAHVPPAKGGGPSVRLVVISDTHEAHAHLRDAGHVGFLRVNALLSPAAPLGAPAHF